MSPAEPQPRRRGRPRSRQADEAIAAATLELLQRHGATGLSIEAVAQRAGVAKTTIYRRWPGKYELILDILAGVRGVIPTPPEGQSVRDDLVFLLTAMSTRHRDPLRGGGTVMRRLIAEADIYPELAQQYIARLVTPRREHTLRVLRRGVREGVIREDADLELVAESLVSPVLMGAWVQFGPRIDVDRIPDLVDLVLAGATPRP